MTKATTKKTEKKSLYTLKMKLNDQIFECETDNLQEAILANKPNFLKTKVILTIEKDGKVCEKMVYGFNGRQLFRNTTFLRVFLNKLIFK